MTTLILVLALFIPNMNKEAPPREPGPLLIAGGGRTPDAVRKRVVELAGGDEAQILVFPQASSLPETGRRIAKMWRAAGAARVRVADLRRPERLLRDLDRASMIWFAGGSQSRLMRTLREARLVERITARHRAGIAVGGSSAGAAVMSGPMITGDAELEKIVVSGTKLGEGLELFPKVIVDQHFHARRRFHRLLAAVLDQPDHVGIGIDESTAIVVRGRSFEVLGEGAVLVIDARGAESEDAPPKALRSFRNVRIHNLVAGQSFDLDARRKIEKR